MIPVSLAICYRCPDYFFVSAFYSLFGLSIELRTSSFVTRLFLPVPVNKLMFKPFSLAKCLTAGVERTFSSLFEAFVAEFGAGLAAASIVVYCF